MYSRVLDIGKSQTFKLLKRNGYSDCVALREKNGSKGVSTVFKVSCQ